jgi:DnaK suppressor protein
MTGLTNTTAPRTATVSQLRELRSALEQQRAFRADQLAELRISASRVAIDDPRAEVIDALRSGAASALQDIETALARMDSGEYGVCVTCSATVPLERLEVVPMAASCMPCARAQHTSGLAGKR